MIVSAYTPPPHCPFSEVPRLFGFVPHSDFRIIWVQCGQRNRQWRCRVVAVASQSGCSRVFRFGLSVEVTPRSQSGGVVAHHGFPNRGPLRKVSGLLIRQMNNQAVNIGVHAVQVKGKKPMASFAGTDISPIEVILDFIPGGRHIVAIGPTCNRLRHCSRQSPNFRLHHCQSMVVTLVNILVKVFHRRDGAADFNIDVALVPHGQVGVIRDDQRLSKTKPKLQGGGGSSKNLSITLASFSRRFGFALLSHHHA